MRPFSIFFDVFFSGSEFQRRRGTAFKKEYELAVLFEEFKEFAVPSKDSRKDPETFETPEKIQRHSKLRAK